MFILNFLANNAVGKHTFRNIVSTGVVLVGLAIGGITYSAHMHIKEGWAQKTRIENALQKNKDAMKKVRLLEQNCDKEREKMAKELDNLKVPPGLFMQGSNVWLLTGGSDKGCGFYYPKGKGYSVVVADPKCASAIFHNDGHALGRLLSNLYGEDVISNFIGKLYGENVIFNFIGNPATAGAVFSRYFSCNSSVPNIGSSWGTWITKQYSDTEKIYAALQYLLENSNNKNGNGHKLTAPSSEPTTNNNNNNDDKESLALGNAKKSIEGKGFVGTGTGTDITDIRRDYFGKFVGAYSNAVNGISGNKPSYNKLLLRVKKLEELYTQVKGQCAHIPDLSTEKKRKNMEKQFITMLKTVNDSLKLLEKSSPGAAKYLQNWFAFEVIYRLNDEVFARMVESLAMKYRGPPSERMFSVDAELLKALEKIAKNIESVNKDDNKNERALTIATYINNLVKHYKGQQIKSNETNITWKSILENSKCFDNAENAIIAAEIEEVNRLLNRNLAIVEQLAPKKTIYSGYFMSLLLLGIGYLLFGRKDE